jgi:6-phosphogluconolactonase
MDFMPLNCFKKIVIAVIATVIVGCGDSSDAPASDNTQNAAPAVAPAAVYTLTNDGATNSVREFRRNTNGTLTFVADYPTGGSGSGDGLDGSTNALFFDSANNRFYAVNAGSNSITVMSLATDGTLSVLNTINSGGVRPISLTAFADLVYVVNAGDANTAANISGFRLAGSQLAPIDGSTQGLSAANPAPAQIEFTPTGTVLAVTERGTNSITTFTLDSNGAAQPGQAQASNGNTPFGFDFTQGGVLVVSEAQGAAAGASTVSSYTLGVNGQLTTISNSIASGQTAACWVEVNRFAPYAYVTNTANDNISIYNVDATGELSLVGNGDSAATGDAPVDLAISNDALFLYSLNTGDDSISVFSIGADGALTPTTGVGSLPANSVGLVAR